MSEAVALFDPNTGSYASIVDGVLQTGTTSGTPTITKNADITTATLSNVAGSATSVTVLAANTSRKGAVIVNDSTAVLYVKCGSSASATSFTYKLGGGDSLIIDATQLYTGILTGIWSSATGSARVTEFA
jgi:hypothetical protein